MIDPEEQSEFTMIAIPVLIEAVGAIVFIAFSLLLVVVLSTPVPA